MEDERIPLEERVSSLDPENQRLEDEVFTL